MHYTCIIFLFLNLFVPPLQGNPIDKAAGLIKGGDVHELANYFAPSVDIFINNESNSYTKAEAEKVITDFFKRNRPEQVSVLHRIETSSNFKFGVYIVRTSGGPFRVAASFKNAGGVFTISELRIESEKTK